MNNITVVYTLGAASASLRRWLSYSHTTSTLLVDTARASPRLLRCSLLRIVRLLALET